jgi:hypothetical protein
VDGGVDTESGVDDEGGSGVPEGKLTGVSLGEEIELSEGRETLVVGGGWEEGN